MKSLFYTLALALVCVVHAGTAHATHKNWLLKNSGSECAFSVPLSTDTTAGTLINSGTGTRSATCPVALSARWGSTAYVVFPPVRKADSLASHVYIKKPSSAGTLSCYAVMQTWSGSLHYSATASNSGSAGVKRLDLAYSGSWGSGSSLESNETQAARSMDFVCSLPNGGTELIGYKMKNCQITNDCDNGGGDPEQDTSGGGGSGLENWVQTSGIECSPASQAQYTPYILRNLNGISNSDSRAPRRVYCPLAPPSDDSREHNRYIRYTSVYFTGGSSASNCVSQQTCPVCKLRWFDRNGTQQEGGTFNIKSTGLLEQPDLTNFPISMEVSLGIACDLPYNVTLQGATALMSVTGISGGI